MEFVKAGVDGSRTHHGSQRDPSPILKTGEPTGTQPLPKSYKHTASRMIIQDSGNMCNMYHEVFCISEMYGLHAVTSSPVHIRS